MRAGVVSVGLALLICTAVLLRQSDESEPQAPNTETEGLRATIAELRAEVEARSQENVAEAEAVAKAVEVALAKAEAEHKAKDAAAAKAREETAQHEAAVATAIGFAAALATFACAWHFGRRPLRAKVEALQANLRDATSRERARAGRIAKERTDGKKFYDMTLTVAKVEDLVGDGFVLEGAKSASVEAANSVGLSIVSFLGYFNTGKTSLVARLCETEDSPAGDERHTEGLAVKIAQQAGLKMACVDTEGLATPVTRAADGVSYTGLRQRKTLEDFQRELASEIADCIVFVCDKISYRDQMDVYCLLDNEEARSGKKVIVVHNLRTVRDVDAMARYQAEVFRMYGAEEVQWATVDGPKCSEPIPTGPGPHRLVHTGGHYSQLVQVFLGDEDEPAMRALNTKAVEWLRTTVAGCAKKRCDFGECVRAGVQRMVSSYVVKLGDKYDVRLVRETSTTDDVQRVVLEWDGDETPTVLPRDVTGLVPRKKAVQNSLTTGDTFYLLTFSVPGVSSKADVTCMSVKAQAMDRILIAFRARSPLVPMSACDDENLAAMTSETGTRDSKGPKDVVDVDFVSKLPFCTGRFTFGVGGGVVWVRLQKSADFKEEPAPSLHPSAPPPTPPAEAIPAADRLVPS